MAVTMAATLHAVDPLEYYRAHLSRGVRPDGRGLLRGRRPVTRNASLTSTDGSAIVRMGRTALLVGVQCDPTVPTEAEPSCGRIVVSVEFSAVCSPAAAATHGGSGSTAATAAVARMESDKAILVELLQQTANGGLVDLEKLCAVAGTAVWSCYCDVYVLEHDGNLTDAAMLAMMAALSYVRLPSVAVDEQSGALTVVEERAMALLVERPVFPCTFGLLDGTLLLDPCAEEEALLSSTFTLLLDDSGELRAVHKPGGAPLASGSMEPCLAAAKARLPMLRATLS